jgi:hypothetical protein
MLITQYDIDAVWLEAEPQAKEAFARLVKDHGWRFAKLLREQVLEAKALDLQEEAIRSA